MGHRSALMHRRSASRPLHSRFRGKGSHSSAQTLSGEKGEGEGEMTVGEAGSPPSISAMSLSASSWVILPSLT